MGKEIKLPDNLSDEEIKRLSESIMGGIKKESGCSGCLSVVVVVFGVTIATLLC